ncbi:hypothetical protein EXD76_05900 [BEV proteobacterium]|nr:hypothetical protein [Candidatus Symbiopectobacterium sp. Chty_BC]
MLFCENFIKHQPIIDLFLNIQLGFVEALLNKSELITTVPQPSGNCYVMRILFGIPNSVIRLSAFTIAMASPT